MKPRGFDAFCGAGGCTRGYQLAGFEMWGCDIEAQPRYVGERFFQADALDLLADTGFMAQFAFVHASPPCQAHSTIGKQIRQRFSHLEHADLIAETRELLEATGSPYVIENVPGAPLKNPAQLCGSWFGLDVRRHRLFETNWPLMSTPCSHHWQKPRFRSLDQRRHNVRETAPVHGGSQLASVVGVHGHINYAGEMELRERAMDVDWMTPYELTQAIPPAMTEYIGTALLEHLQLAPATERAS